jgi:hypothetical protein
MRFVTLNRLTLLAALAFATPALAVTAAPKKAAEEAPLPPPPNNDAMKIGVGLAVMGSTLSPGTGAGGVVAFYVPIDMGGKFRIEPWIGLGRSGARGTGGTSTFGMEFGAGGFMLLKPVNRINAYLGGRFGLGITSQSRTDPVTGTSTSNTGVDIGILPAAGVEFLPDPHFSVGIEGQLGLIIRTGGGTAVDFGTNGLAFLRYYM